MTPPGLTACPTCNDYNGRVAARHLNSNVPRNTDQVIDISCVCSTVTDLVPGSGLKFEERGEHVLKGVPGTWAIYAVSG